MLHRAIVVLLVVAPTVFLAYKLTRADEANTMTSGAVCRQLAGGTTGQVYGSGAFANTTDAAYIEASCPVVRPFEGGGLEMRAYITVTDNNSTTPHSLNTDFGCQLFSTNYNWTTSAWSATEFTASSGVQTLTTDQMDAWSSGIANVYCTIPKKHSTGGESAIRHIKFEHFYDP